MKTTIRQCEPDDYKAIRALYAQTSCYAGTLQLPHPTEAKWKEKLSKEPAHYYSLVAIKNDEIVRQIGMQVNTYPRRTHVANIGMGVSEKHRNSGVGSLLLKEMISLANNWLAITRIELEVFVDNTIAIQMYKNHGFIEEGTGKSYVFRNGEYTDVKFMAKVDC